MKHRIICAFIILVVSVTLVFLPMVINHLYYLDAPGKFFVTDLDVSDLVAYFASALSFLGTMILGILTLHQNKRAQDKTDEINKHYFRATLRIPNTKDYVGKQWKVDKVG